MKHFSWALYILLGAPIIFKFSWDVVGLWLIFFPILAVLVAILAIYSIDKEGTDFLDALGTVLSIEKRLDFHKENDKKIPNNLVSSKHKSFLCVDEKYPIDKLKTDKRFDISSNRFKFVLYFLILLIIGIGELIFILLDYCLNCN